MKYARSIAASILICLLACSAVAQTPPATSSIRGSVTQGDQPVKGLGLSLVRSGIGLTEVIGHTETDGEGRYQFNNIPAGEYQINLNSPHLVPMKDEMFGIVGKRTVVAVGESLDNVNFSLQRGGVVTGKVTDSEGYPLIGQLISIERVDTRGAATTVYGQYYELRRTDDRGIYRLFGLPTGRFRIYVGAKTPPSGPSSERPVPQTYYPGTRDAAQAEMIEVRAGAEVTGIDIKLPPSERMYEVAGRVVNAQTGLPVPHVRVGIGISFGQSTSSSIGNFRTNEKGEFRLTGFPAGKYVIFAGFENDADQYSDQTEIEVKNGNLEGVIVKINQGATINAFITIDGSPDPQVLARLTQLRISARPLSQPRPQMATIRPQQISANGSLVFRGLAPGKYGFNIDLNQVSRGFSIIRIEQAGKAITDGIEVAAGKEYTDVRLVISTGIGGVRGRVQVDPQYADLSELPENVYVHVSLVPVNLTAANHSFGNARVNRQGEFTIDGLAPGEYAVTVSAGYETGAERRTVIVRGIRTIVAIKRGEYSEVTVPIEIRK